MHKGVRVFRSNHWLNKEHLVLTIVILALAGVGVYFLTGSHADSPYVSENADSGVLSVPATKQTCSGSSDGDCIEFGASLVNTPLAVYVKNGQLVNGNGQAFRLLGVSASGTEDACIQNKGLSWGASNTISEDETTAAAMKTWHINAVRIPLNEDCWLGINGAPAAYSGQNYQTAIENWVNTLNQAGIITVLDLHWAAPGTYAATEQWPMADEDHSPTFWTQVATEFKSDPAVIFDPFNEPMIGGRNPTAADWSCWLNGCTTNFTPTGATTAVSYTTAGMQQLVNIIRATGASQPIMVGGLNWAGDPCGLSNTSGNGGICTEIANMPTDPDNQLAISFHTYSWTACVTTSCWNSVAQAAKAAGTPIITGELGEDDCSDDYIDNYMNWADSSDVSYLVWSWEIDYSTTTTCTPPSYDFMLLSDWNGTPSTHDPEAADYKAHLLEVNP
jgi:hypothetical protein